MIEIDSLLLMFTLFSCLHRKTNYAWVLRLDGKEARVSTVGRVDDTWDACIVSVDLKLRLL